MIDETRRPVKILVLIPPRGGHWTIQSTSMNWPEITNQPSQEDKLTWLQKPNPFGPSLTRPT